MKKIVVLLSGKINSGKNKIAEYLKIEFAKTGLNVGHDYFAQALKDNCKEDFHILAEYLNRLANILEKKSGCKKISKELRVTDENWYENKTPITRILLQAYGTEIFRNRVGKNWWVDQLKKKLEESKDDLILVTDCRFPNEIDGMWSDEYLLLRLRLNRKIEIAKEISEHESETALDEWQSWDYIIENESTLDELESSARIIAKKILENAKNT